MSDHRPSNSLKKTFEDNQDLTRKIIDLIRMLVQAEELYTKELIKKYQVSVSQLHCLLALYENGPLSISQIAGFIMVRSSTVTGVIDRLEKKKFVRRVRKSNDRRVIIIELTDAGKKFAQNAPSPVQRKIMEGLKNLPASQIEKIVYGLNMLTRMLDVQDQ